MKQALEGTFFHFQESAKGGHMNDSESTERLHKVYSSRNIQELEERYDAWAEDYEEDICSFGYKSPTVITCLIGRYVESQEGPILDAGAGTGILGERLASCGYNDLTGIDLSQAMLDVAEKKGVYQDLRQMVLGEHLDFSDNSFNAVVSMEYLQKIMHHQNPLMSS